MLPSGKTLAAENDNPQIHKDQLFITLSDRLLCCPMCRVGLRLQAVFASRRRTGSHRIGLAHPVRFRDPTYQA
jgi:hypothetical protein